MQIHIIILQKIVCTAFRLTKQIRQIPALSLSLLNKLIYYNIKLKGEPRWIKKLI